MTEIKNPGAPVTDELARNAARNALISPLTSITDGTGITENDEVIGAVADTVARNHTVTWERDVNANGVPVRRYVMRGQWEVDPEPQKPHVQTGDVVAYEDHEHGHHDDWIVVAVPVRAVPPDDDLVFIKRPEWRDHRFVSTSGRTVRIVRRPETRTAAVGPGRGDEVVFADRRDGGRRWTVLDIRTTRQGWQAVTMTSPGLDETAQDAVADASLLIVTRKAEQ